MSGRGTLTPAALTLLGGGDAAAAALACVGDACLVPSGADQSTATPSAGQPDEARMDRRADGTEHPGQ